MQNFDISEETARNRWKKLKNSFQHEHAKIPKPRSGDSAEALNYTVPWPLYPYLLFAKDQIMPNRSTGNLTPGIDEEDDESTEEVPEEESEEVPERPTRFIKPNRRSDFKYTEDEDNSDSNASEESQLDDDKDDDFKPYNYDDDESNSEKEEDIKPSLSYIKSNPSKTKQKKEESVKPGVYRKKMINIEEKRLDIIKSWVENSSDNDTTLLMGLKPYFTNMTPEVKVKCHDELHNVVKKYACVTSTWKAQEMTTTKKRSNKIDEATKANKTTKIIRVTKAGQGSKKIQDVQDSIDLTGLSDSESNKSPPLKRSSSPNDSSPLRERERSRSLSTPRTPPFMKSPNRNLKPTSPFLYNNEDYPLPQSPTKSGKRH